MNRRSFLASIIGASLAAKLSTMTRNVTWPSKFTYPVGGMQSLTLPPGSRYVRIVLTSDPDKHCTLQVVPYSVKENSNGEA